MELGYTFILQNKQKHISSLRLENESTLWKSKNLPVTHIFYEIIACKLHK